jgi:murein DD-endopeptidase MepM/ murein hydrolase activator NlpD
VFLAPVMPGARAQDTTISFIHKERSLQPGELVLFEIQSSSPLKRLALKALDREFPAFAVDQGRRWTGLVGIDLETRPGRYRLHLIGIGMDGEVVNEGDTLVVKDKKFPTRELTVDEKYVSPPADALDRIREERAKVNAIFAAISPEKLWKKPFIVPVSGKVISAFGKRSVFNGKQRSPHRGTDFRGAVGTPIHAPNTGRVVLAANLYYSGNTVILDHGLGLYSYLCHMASFSVKEGDLVHTGDLVGKVGATGRVTGPHLHWTVRLAGSCIDPLSVVEMLGSSER